MTVVKFEQPLAANVPEAIHSPKGGRVLLTATGVCKTFGGQVVLNNLDLELREGEIVLLRGDNGSGKTTLLNILTGNLAPDAGSIRLFADGVEEAFDFPRRWWQDLNPLDHFTPERVAREGLGRTWQDIRLFSFQSLRDNVAVARPRHPGEAPFNVLFRPSAVTRHEQAVSTDADDVLARLGMASREHSSGDKISLGQAKRVAIARATQAGARILFLDEPLAGLDAGGTEGVISLLKELAHRNNLTLVIVEHVLNAPRILDFASSVWTLRDGGLSVGTPDQVSAQINATIGRGLLGLIQTTLAPNATLVGQTNLAGAVLSVSAQMGAKRETPRLEVRDLVVHRGNRLVIGTRKECGQVQGLSFALHRGTLAVLLAPNGWGKTTLLEAIAGVIPITAGEILFNGTPLQTLPPWQRAALGVSFLRARDYDYPSLTVHEMVRLSGLRTVPAAMARFLSRRMSDLSGGERQRVVLASTFSLPHRDFVMLDEPFSGLDLEAIQQAFTPVTAESNSCFLFAIPTGVG